MLRLTANAFLRNSEITMNREAYKRARGSRPNRVIADLAGTDVYHLSRIINGHVAPNIVLARRIADAVGAKLDDLWPAERTPSPADPPKTRRLRAIPGGAKGTPKRPATTAEAGRDGGLARARKLTKAQRSEAARKASMARWSRASDANAMCGRHHPALRLIRGGLDVSIPTATDTPHTRPEGNCAA